MDETLGKLLDAVNKLFATTEMLASKIDAANQRVDYLASFLGISNEEGKTPEPPGQLAGLTINVLDEVLPPQKASVVKTYVLRVLALFRNYIKSVVLFGSAKRKQDYGPNSDIDIAFIVDPSDVQSMTKEELNAKLFSKLVEMASAYSEKIHPQGWTIVDLWRGIVKPDPVMLTLLRDGIAVYDTGFFYSLQKLYKEGEIVPTISSIDSLISNAELLLSWAQNTLSTKLTNDLFLAVVNSSQAMLMEYGYMPPIPKEVPKALYDVFVTKEKLLDPADVRIAEDIITWYKKIEKGEIAAVDGKEFSEKYDATAKFLEKAFKIISDHRRSKGLPAPTIVDFAENIAENAVNKEQKY